MGRLMGRVDACIILLIVAIEHHNSSAAARAGSCKHVNRVMDWVKQAM